MAYVRVWYDSEYGCFDCVDTIDHEHADECEGCNMDVSNPMVNDDVYEFGLIEISPVKMPLIFANEYGSYDRKFGKGILKNNESFLNDTVDSFSTFQKVIAAPEIVKPPTSAALSPESIITRSHKDRKSTRLNSSHHAISRMPSSA